MVFLTKHTPLASFEETKKWGALFMALPIFVVDSSPAVRRMVEEISTSEGFEVVGFQDGPTALEAARRNSPSLIIADYHLDNMTFSGFCKEINKLDNLTETDLISLVNPADRPDENLLRTLGVKAFLKKPFQSEDLLGVLKSLQQKSTDTSNSKGLKRRVWPPTSSSTNSNDDEAIDHLSGGDSQKEPMNHPGSPSTASLAPSVEPAAPEDAMRGLFDQLLQSMTKRSELSLAELLPRVIEEKLGTHVRPIVQKELQAQLGNILSQEYLTTIIHPLVAQALPALIKKELEASEPLIRHIVSDVATASLGESIDRLVKDKVHSEIHEHLPAVVRDQMETVDQLVKEELERAVQKQAPLLANDMVRSAVGQTVEQAVQRIVPDIAEQHIKAELKRLIETEEASHPSTI
jgi:CheY-like chemotaxis protein